MSTAPFMIGGKQARLREQFLVAAILAPPTVFPSGENQEQMVLPKGKQTKIAPQFSTLPCKSLCQAIDVVNSIRTGDAVPAILALAQKPTLLASSPSSPSWEPLLSPAPENVEVGREVPLMVTWETMTSNIVVYRTLF